MIGWPKYLHGQSKEAVAPLRPGFGFLLRLTLWAAGLLVAMMTGMLSVYAVLSALYAGSRIYAQFRKVKERRVDALGPGDAS